MQIYKATSVTVRQFSTAENSTGEFSHESLYGNKSMVKDYLV